MHTFDVTMLSLNLNIFYDENIENENVAVESILFQIC